MNVDNNREIQRIPSRPMYLVVACIYFAMESVNTVLAHTPSEELTRCPPHNPPLLSSSITKGLALKLTGNNKGKDLTDFAADISADYVFSNSLGPAGIHMCIRSKLAVSLWASTQNEE